MNNDPRRSYNKFSNKLVIDVIDSIATQRVPAAPNAILPIKKPLVDSTVSCHFELLIRLADNRPMFCTFLSYILNRLFNGLSI